jgi:hypothetical protein
MHILPFTPPSTFPTPLELPQNIIHHIPTKRSPRAEHRRIPKLHRHALNPLMMLRVFRVCGVTRVLCLLSHGSRVELLCGIGVVARVDVTRRLAVLLKKKNMVRIEG